MLNWIIISTISILNAFNVVSDTTVIAVFVFLILTVLMDFVNYVYLPDEDDIKEQAPQGTTHYFTIGKRVIYLTKTNVKQRIGSKIFAFLFNVKPLN